MRLLSLIINFSNATVDFPEDVNFIALVDAVMFYYTFWRRWMVTSRAVRVGLRLLTFNISNGAGALALWADGAGMAPNIDSYAQLQLVRIVSAQIRAFILLVSFIVNFSEAEKELCPSHFFDWHDVGISFKDLYLSTPSNLRCIGNKPKGVKFYGRMNARISSLPCPQPDMPLRTS